MRRKKSILIRRFIWVLLVFTSVFFLLCIPKNLFINPTSTVLYASDGTLLSAQIATDGQWRFPEIDSIPKKFEQCLLLFEDKNFYHHNGIYLPSVFRAVRQNVLQKRRAIGASTITMQVVRMSRNNPSRNMFEKMLEMLRAMRLEWRFSKDEIIKLYASNAPFGGNVVGLEAAAWRYYGRRPDQLSWAESATLAVLPNAPSLIFPGKNQELLLAKRNRVLNLLHQAKFIDQQTLELSYLEPLPQKPFALPQTAQHLLHLFNTQYGKGKKHHSTIDYHQQVQSTQRLQMAMPELEANLVHNAAVLIIDVKTGNVITYIGNTNDPHNKHSNMVDVVQAPRSTGSILKPILYAAMLHDGLILPNTLLPDIPIQYDGFAPQNYDETYDGAVPASQALSRSLNVPAVAMLKDYGYSRFYHLLQKMKFSTLSKPADHYGLSLILGGAEGTLWDITHSYAAMSRTLLNYQNTNGEYCQGNYAMRNIVQRKNTTTSSSKSTTPPLDAASIWCTYRALLEVNRPETELGWDAYSSATPIAWKTGTSFGNRDAWAIGTTPEYVVGVWVGNADGQGRPELTGVSSAAPILFDIFDLLPQRTWFNPPYEGMKKIPVCHQSGMRLGPNCETSDTVFVPLSGLRTQTCSFHQLIHTDEFKTHRLSNDCAEPHLMKKQNWFVLPPVQEYYYKLRHPEYATLPPFAVGCGHNNESPIGFIYPKSDAQIFIPKNLQQEFEKVVIKATHRAADAVLFWHLDNNYLGETKGIHNMSIYLNGGKHTITLVDANGESLAKVIEVIER